MIQDITKLPMFVAIACSSIPRCTMLCECKYCKPPSIDRTTTTASFSVNFPRSKSLSNNSPPVALKRECVCLRCQKRIPVHLRNHAMSHSRYLQFKHQIKLFSDTTCQYTMLHVAEGEREGRRWEKKKVSILHTATRTTQRSQSRLDETIPRELSFQHRPYRNGP